MKKTYSEKLRDPRWQKKRLQILERDNWTCQGCADTESTLHVHHRYYTKGAEPWEYEDAALQTLCEECHTEERELRPEAEGELLNVLRKHFSASDTSNLALCLLVGIEKNPQHENPSAIMDAMCYALEVPELQREMLAMHQRFMDDRDERRRARAS